MGIKDFLELLIETWFILIVIHITLAQKKIVVVLIYGIISSIFYIPMLIDMLGYFPPPSALNQYMGAMVHLFIPASLLFIPLVFISIIVSLKNISEQASKKKNGAEQE